MIILSLDIGKKRTGVAFADTTGDVIAAKDTITHDTDEELIEAASQVAKDLHAEIIAVGLPLLPDGTEGEQARHTKAVAAALEGKTGLCPIFIDERYTSSFNPLCHDPDAMAACAIADIALSQRKKSS